MIALLRAGSPGSDTIFGILMSVLNSFIIVCVGHVVTFIGQSVYVFMEIFRTSNPDPTMIQNIHNMQ